MALPEVDRKKLCETFHTWCKSKREFHILYGNCSLDSKEMIDDLFTKMENVNYATFQSYYFRKGTGWASKTPVTDRRKMLRMGWTFLAEYGRGRIQLGKHYKPYAA